MMAMLRLGKRETMSCTFSAAWSEMAGSAAISTMICPMPRTFCKDVNRRGSSPGLLSGVVWSYVAITLPESFRRRGDTNVGITMTGFMHVLCFGSVYAECGLPGRGHGPGAAAARRRARCFRLTLIL